NNYYSRSCDAFKTIATTKGANLRKGIDDAIGENSIKPLNYIIVKAAYFTMLTLNYNMTEWLSNLEASNLGLITKVNPYYYYNGNESANLAF
ncbi:hypothetical protein OFC04_25330, partial [Escherichia coli]|nr:hypothetical protein [Escherichia coli]